VTKKFVVIHEAPADFTTAIELADRVLKAEIGWSEESLLDSQRLWVAEDDSGNRLLWKSIKRLSRQQRIRLHGHFDGQPGLPDAKAARRAIAYVRRRFNEVDAVLLIRDTDDQPERRNGLEQARSAFASPPVVVIGLAVVERESWVISGFNPANEDEQRTLNEERQRLGFNPCECSHQLTACKNDRAKTSPKRVLAVLTDDNNERQRACWLDTPLSVLEERGRLNGLADYLNQIKRALAPMLAPDNPAHP
jgi:hypothetical protein